MRPFGGIKTSSLIARYSYFGLSSWPHLIQNISLNMQNNYKCYVLPFRGEKKSALCAMLSTDVYTCPSCPDARISYTVIDHKGKGQNDSKSNKIKPCVSRFFSPFHPTLNELWEEVDCRCRIRYNRVQHTMGGATRYAGYAPAYLVNQVLSVYNIEMRANVLCIH
jgi:hypothetical protein